MATHVVVRPFPGRSGILRPGTQVNAADWPNTRSLVKRGYMREVSPQAPSKPAAADHQAADGRQKR